MTTVIISHTTADFDAWKPAFDEHAAVRASNGATSHRLLRNGNDVTVIMEFPSVAAFESFASEPSLADAMKNGGVVSAPNITVLDEVEVVSY